MSLFAILYTLMVFGTAAGIVSARRKAVVAAFSAVPRPAPRTILRDEWKASIRSLVVMIFIVTPLTVIVGPTGWGAFFWLLFVLVFGTVSVLQAIDWDPTGNIGRFMNRMIWKRIIRGRIARGLVVQAASILAMLVVALIMLIVWVFGSIEMPSVNGPVVTPSTEATTESASPSTKVSPTTPPTVDTEPQETTEPTSTAEATPSPLTTSPIPGTDPKRIKVTTGCVVLNLYEDPVKQLDFDPKRVEVCVNGEWMDWSDWKKAAPATVPAGWSARSDDLYYFLIKFEGKPVLIRSDTITS